MMGMFFRRQRPRTVSLQDRIEELKAQGFNVSDRGPGQYLATRDGCAAVFTAESDDSARIVESPGVLLGGGIAGLVDGGFQKFFQTSSGLRKPALASDLKALHNFQEDLRGALGLRELYNEALGTVSKYYLCDRVEDRDHGVPKRPWER